MLTKGGIGSSFKAICCVYPEKFTAELENALGGAHLPASGSRLRDTVGRKSALRSLVNVS